MEKYRDFRSLVAWQRAHELTVGIYKETQSFPKGEIYGLTSQIRRASVSIAANIAEGWKRRSPNDRCHFLNIAEGSNEEVKCLLLLSKDLGFLNEETCQRSFALADQIGAILYSLIQSCRSPK